MIQTAMRRPSVSALRARLREQWDVLSDDDINDAGGSLDRLVEVIHARTGEPRAAVKKSLRRVLMS